MSSWLDFIFGGEGGGSSVTVESLSVTANGTYTAPTGKAYSPVDVSVSGSATLIEKNISANGTYNASSDSADGYSKVVVSVANSYSAGDEGKVVKNGALASQGSATYTSNNTYDTTDISSVTVNVSGGGTTEAEEKDVNFYDYDGFRVASYSAADFASLDALPANPSHDGLTAQGWNWSLADAKTYVASYGFLDIGQSYTTSDGKTRLYCHFEMPRPAPYIGVCPNGTVTIDWGDGSATDTLTGTSLTTNKIKQHTYSAAGDYVITIEPAEGTTFAIHSGSTSSQLLSSTNSVGDTAKPYLNCLQKIELGKGANFGNYAFAYCFSLQSISVPNTVTSFGTYDFQYCGSLKHVTVPSGVTALGNYDFAYCRNLKTVAIPKSVTSLGTYEFNYCDTISEISTPSGITSIGSYCFGYCNLLHSIIVPSGVTSLGNNAFMNDFGLLNLKFYGATAPTASNSNAFGNSIK